MNQPPIDWRVAAAWAMIALGIAVFWALVAVVALVILTAVPVLW
jgi:hypothetical protein